MSTKLKDPLYGQTSKSIKSYIIEKPLKVGDQMIIYNGQAQIDQYTLAEVTEINIGRMKRVRLSKSAHWGGYLFYRTGKNCDAPTGQSIMIPPLPQVMDLLGNKDHYEEPIFGT